jgi:UDP-2,3-diacylglucosamine pyrophosphatase LpxH
MKKIKIVVSDLHLSSGKDLPDGTTNTLEEFHYDQKFKEFIHYYSNGEYKDYEVELVINGDFLNFIQVDYRGHYLTVCTESICFEKMQRIVQGHAVVFDSLREFASLPNHTITYIVGNHDQSMLWKKTRNYLNEVLNTEVNFKNIVYFFDGVHIEHGHMYEAANRLDPKKFFLKKNLPEPILNLPFGSHFFVDFVMKLKLEDPYVDKVRPFYSYLRWSLIFSSRFAMRALFSLIGFFFNAAFTHDSRRGWSLKHLLRIFFEGAIFPDLSSAARKILTDERVNTVIFGHSHVYHYRRWGENKEYFNTGTWTEVTSLDTGSLGKITKLTYVLLEYAEMIEKIDKGEDGIVENKTYKPRGRLKEWRGYHRIEEDVVIS